MTQFIEKLLLTSMIILLLTILNGCQKEPDLPNIVFIMADDLGYGDLGCYGAEKIHTPNIDRLADEGMQFTDAHSGSAVCTPTRYGVLTGRYCWRSWLKNWVLWENMPLLIDITRLTVASMLRQQGYTTACIGKWHLGWGVETDHGWDGDVKPGPLEVGFDYFFGVPHSHNSPDFLKVFMENHRIIGLNPGDDIHDEEVMKRVRRNLEETAINLSEVVVRFIEENKNRPFFLYYPTTNIHSPITPNERFKVMSEAGQYGDFVVEFDWAVGEIISALDRLNLTENTLIFVTSDNGGTLEATEFGHQSNAPWRGSKKQIYEGGHRIPFIVRWPGKVEPGSVCDVTICLTDLMATCAAIIQYPLPRDAAEDSYNILPLLLGQTYEGPIREATVHHSVSGMFAIRQGKWKLIEGLGNGGPEIGPETDVSAEGQPKRDTITGDFKDLVYYFPPPPQPGAGEPEGQLYDLESDPGETNNLWNEH
ncbi:MAG: arylsulfatase, partial [Bacteroidales bacterium]|nr:arylsulfatase [Bacteroidales bacterium]